MSDARWVAARSRTGDVPHAVWVTHNTPLVMTVRVIGGREFSHMEPDTRPGMSVCGVMCPEVIAGENHGHDWDRVPSLKGCINCRRKLRELT